MAIFKGLNYVSITVHRCMFCVVCSGRIHRGRHHHPRLLRVGIVLPQAGSVGRMVPGSEVAAREPPSAGAWTETLTAESKWDPKAVLAAQNQVILFKRHEFVKSLLRCVSSHRRTRKKLSLPDIRIKFNFQWITTCLHVPIMKDI